MKRIWIVILLLGIVAMIGCSSRNQEHTYKLDINDKVMFNEELTIEEVKEGVLVVSHKFPWDANSMIIEMENGEIVLIDTPYENEATKTVIQWIRERAGEEVKITEINTGFHFDNLGGNQYLAEQGIEIVGTSDTVNMISERGEAARSLFLDWLKDEKYKKYYDVYTELAYVEPTEIVNLNRDEEIELSFGDEALVLYYPEESHSPDNIAVYYPRKKVLFGGCMIKDLQAKNLGNIADANLEGWAESIRKLKSKYSQESIDAIVPGHGEVGDYSLLDVTEKLLSNH